MKKKVIVFSGLSSTFLNLRKFLLRGFVANVDQVIACAPDYVEAEVGGLKDIGVDFRQLEMQRTGMNPIADFGYLHRLKKFLRVEQPDAVFSYHIKAAIFVSLAARLVGVPRIYVLLPGLGYIFAEGGGVKKKLLQALVFRLYRFALKDVDVAFFQNPDDLETFKQHRLLSSKTKAIRVHGSGVDLNHYEHAQAVVDPVRFLFIARLIRDKGIPEYGEAARILKARYGDRVEFSVVGPLDPNPSAISKAELDEWVKDGCIVYHGEEKDVRPFIRDASVFVLPSFYMEGVPRTILESLSMGRPIVTTTSRGCKETVVEGKNGFLIPPRDVDALVTALEYFIQNPETVKSMGQASRMLAESRYDVNLVTAEMFKGMKLDSSIFE
ncbi:glycosyltransferase family 4 protein [Akkermansiaceae bacterium]|nr:glycosyltransferase family 4 protein [Akkermansiaceae bacterium]MDA7790394.1 glycosyltransferase family 4 protein [Akkermansiaceae bacterium]MDA7872308.1 glycosyltransferase family 4 protein [Akkermansiaceae bacterium]